MTAVGSNGAQSMLWRESGIATPEGVLLDYERAGITSRALARIIDLLALGGIMLFFGNFIVVAAAAVSPTVGVVVGMLIGFSAIFLYPVFFEVRWQGRTLGKSAMGLRVITTEGASVRLRHASIRSMMQLVDIFATLGGAAILTALSSPEGQRLGDLAAGTYVVRDRRNSLERDEREIRVQRPAGADEVIAGIDTSSLRHEQSALIRSFLVRAGTLSPASRASIAADLADRVADSLRIVRPAEMHPETWLACVAVSSQARASAEERAALPPPRANARRDRPLPPPSQPPPGPRHSPPSVLGRMEGGGVDGKRGEGGQEG